MGTTSRKCPKVQPITMVKLAKMLQQKITHLHKPTDLQNVWKRHFSFPFYWDIPPRKTDPVINLLHWGFFTHLKWRVCRFKSCALTVHDLCWSTRLPLKNETSLCLSYYQEEKKGLMPKFWIAYIPFIQKFMDCTQFVGVATFWKGFLKRL